MFTSEQKAAIIRISFFILSADGKIEDSEMDFSFSMWQLIGVNEQDADLARTMTGIEACNVVTAMAEEDKSFVCALLGCMILSDGEAAEQEVRVWRTITEICNLPAMSIEQATEIVRARLE
ncbi:MAG: hypothetical protein J6K33_04320 [Alistipes sp.]|nr:hypothetical protein [Rikenellaceae bacterium]MBP3497042.1 hypothetical protein [Alistipes sp.]MBQ8853258.1 hypothetical protein [Alistipes sp.]